MPCFCFVARVELPDRSAATLFLPLTKDNKTKEETHKLMNGNSGDSADWVQLSSVYLCV